MSIAAGTYSYRNIWRVAYPILISLVMEQMIGLTDTAFLGRVGEVELGASAIAIVYYMVLFMIGFGFSIGAHIGTDIYLVSTCLSGYASTQHNYVFDTITETFRTLSSLSPEGFVTVASLVEDNFVYLVGGGGTDDPRIFKYFPDTDMYIKCGYLPGGYGACPICYGNEFLSFGGYGKTRNLHSVTIDKREDAMIEGNTVVIDTIENPKDFNKSAKLLESVPGGLLNFNNYQTKYFVDVLYKVGEEYIDVPTYYGDGTQWIKIKN